MSTLRLEVAGLKKLLNLADSQTAIDMLKVQEYETVQHQVSVYAVLHTLPAPQPWYQLSLSLMVHLKRDWVWSHC